MSEASNNSTANPASSGTSTPSSAAPAQTSAPAPQQQPQQQPVAMQLQQQQQQPQQLQQQQQPNQLQMTPQQLHQLQQLQQQQQQQPMQMQQLQPQQMNQQLQQQHQAAALQQQQQPMQMLSGGMGSTNQAIMHGSSPAYSMSSAGQVVRSSMPPAMGMQTVPNMPGMGLPNVQGVQVIQQPQFIPPQYLQQQQQQPQHIMLQQAIQGIPQQMNLLPQQQQQPQATMQQQPQAKSPGMASPSVTSQQQQAASSGGVKMVTSSGGTSMAPGIVTFSSRGAMPQSQPQQQQAPGGKLTAPGVLQGQLAAGNKLSQIRPGQGTPLVIGQIGMVSSMAGTAGSPLLTNSLRFTSTSPLAPPPTNTPLVPQPGQPQQMVTGTVQPPQQQAQQLPGPSVQLPTSPAATVLSMSQIQNMGFATCTNNLPTLGTSPQMLSCTQGTAIFNSQPVYIRASPLQQQQQQQQLINMQQQQVTTASSKSQQVQAANPQQQQQIKTAPQQQQQTIRSVANILPQQVRALAPTSSPQVKPQGTKSKAGAPVKPKPASSPSSSSSATQVKIAPLPTVTVSPKVRPALQTTLTNTVASTGSEVVLTSVTATTTSTSASNTPTTTAESVVQPAPPPVSSSSSPAVTSVSTSRAVTLPERKPELTLFPEDKAGDSAAGKPGAVLVNGSEKKQAIVKPVLTHVIEGFVIQEATSPFPVQRSNIMLTELPAEVEKPEKAEDPPSPITSQPPSEQPVPSKKHTGQKLTCEFCRKTDYASKFKRSKRFCSLSCAKRYNVGCSKRMGLVKGENTDSNAATPMNADATESEDGSGSSSSGNSSVTGDEPEDMEASSVDDNSAKDEEEEGNSSAPVSPPTLFREDEQRAPATPAAATTPSNAPSAPSAAISGEEELIVPPKHPRDWSVDDVYHFIRTLPGCGPYSDEFLRQEIDGQALLLLKEDHLMTTMSMRLGPALKICDKITSLKEDRS